MRQLIKELIAEEAQLKKTIAEVGEDGRRRLREQLSAAHRTIDRVEASMDDAHGTACLVALCGLEFGMRAFEKAAETVELSARLATMADDE